MTPRISPLPPVFKIMLTFDKFLEKFVESFNGKDPMIFSVLGNVFSMRIIGNKTHGDLAEIALKDTHEKILQQFFDFSK